MTVAKVDLQNIQAVAWGAVLVSVSVAISVQILVPKGGRLMATPTPVYHWAKTPECRVPESPEWPGLPNVPT